MGAGVGSGSGRESSRATIVAGPRRAAIVSARRRRAAPALVAPEAVLARVRRREGGVFARRGTTVVRALRGVLHRTPPPGLILQPDRRRHPWVKQLRFWRSHDGTITTPEGRAGGRAGAQPRPGGADGRGERAAELSKPGAGAHAPLTGQHQPRRRLGGLRDTSGRIRPLLGDGETRRASAGATPGTAPTVTLKGRSRGCARLGSVQASTAMSRGRPAGMG